MGNDEKVRPQQLSHFLMNLVSFHQCVRTAEDVAGTLRRRGDDDGRQQPIRAETQPGHRTA
jgi:hypothetical protein